MLAGQVGKAAILIPLVGYSLLFSDFVEDLWKFQPLLGDHAVHLAVWRPRLVYYGLVLLAVSQVIYFFAAHHIVKKYDSTSEFIDAEESILFAVTFHPDNDVSPGAPRRVDGLYKLEEHFKIEHRRHDDGELRIVAFHCVFNAAQCHRPSTLKTCLLLASVGYLFLFIPSADLFLRVSLSLIR